MKKFTFFAVMIGLIVQGLAQAPRQFNYQAALRDNAGELIASEDVQIAIDILRDSPEGTVVFEEIHQTQTNEFGLVSLVIGSVNSLEDIDWTQGPFFIRVSLNGQMMGVSQLLSVPFALHAFSSADSFSGNYQDLTNLPDLEAFISVEDPQPGDLLYYTGEQWNRLPLGEEGQVLTVIDGAIQWASLPEGEIPNQVVDLDGNIYQTVMIAGKEWMASNLRTTRYRDGSAIISGLDADAWENTNQGAFGIYPHDAVEGIGSDDEMAEAYGLMYNWHAVNDERGLCPVGWRVPNLTDVTEMVNYLIENDEEISNLNVGNYLKSCRQAGSPLGGDCDVTAHPRWNEWNLQYGNNLTGFSALPAGNKSPTGSYSLLGLRFYFWTATENPDPDNENQAHVSWLQLYSGGMAGFFTNKNSGNSVRCIKITP